MRSFNRTVIELCVTLFIVLLVVLGGFIVWTGGDFESSPSGPRQSQQQEQPLIDKVFMRFFN